MASTAMTASTARIERVGVDALSDPPSNPNRLGPDKLGLLVRSILRIGYVQPVLARPTPKGLVIVDGVHRVDAVRWILDADVENESMGAGSPLEHLTLTEDDWSAIEAFQARYEDHGGIEVVVKELTEDEARAVQIGMNRLRGELDFADVASTLADLSTHGWDVGALTLAGFTESEVNDLIKTTRDLPDVPPNMGELPGGGDDEDTSAPGPFILELPYATRQELNRAKRGLRKAAGKGNRGPEAMAAGLLRLIGGA